MRKFNRKFNNCGTVRYGCNIGVELLRCKYFVEDCTELYFTDTLWPDFDDAAIDAAISSFQTRERRFGRTSEQLPAEQQRG